MHGTGIHVLDTFTRLMGPAQPVNARLVAVEAPSDTNL